MALLIGFAAVLILVVFAMGHRRLALGLAAAAVAAGGLLYTYYREEEHRFLSRIPESEVVLESMTLKPDVGGYRISGRIRNKSAQFRLKQIDMVITVQDCPGEDAEPPCVTLGKSQEILNLDVPPGETRDFTDSVRLTGSRVKLKGRLEWSFSISQIRAE